MARLLLRCAVPVLIPALVAGALGALVLSGRSHADVVVYPQPGTDTAHHETAVSFRGASIDRLGDVRVAGSRSGPHAGALRAHADGAGATFAPDKPFVPGERVEVAADVPLGLDRRVTFEVAIPGDIEAPAEPVDVPADAPARVTEFVTEPSIVAPVVAVEGQQVDGLVLSTPQATPLTRAAAMITDASGELVWWRRPDGGNSISNLFATRLDGQPVLAWFEGQAPYTPGWFLGQWVVVDRSYTELARISAAGGLQAGVHELEITDRGTAFVVIYQPVVRDATDRGGDAETVVLDGVIQEVDVDTGDVYFEWHSLDHVPLVWSQLRVPPNNLFDYAHINSVTQGPSGDLLVSMRHTSMVTEIDRQSGRLNWVLGGRGATVDVGADEGVSYPHHAQWRDDDTLSVFDNGVADERSRGVVYDLDETAHKAEVVREYVERPPVYTATQGSLQHLDEGVAVAGWGELGMASAFGDGGPPTGRIHLHAPSYRILVADWRGTPAAPPAVHARDDRLYVSWNGATEVATWEVVAGDDRDSMAVVTQVPRTGFETALPLDGVVGDMVAVRALDAAGDVVVTTEPKRLR